MLQLAEARGVRPSPASARLDSADDDGSGGTMPTGDDRRGRGGGRDTSAPWADKHLV